MNVVGWWASGLFQLLSLFAMYSNFSMISMCDFDNQEKSYVLKYNSSVYLSFFSLEGMTIPQTKKKTQNKTALESFLSPLPSTGQGKQTCKKYRVNE